MSIKEEFINYINELLNNQENVPENIKCYWEIFINETPNDSDKPLFTENGKRVIQFLQSANIPIWKAKDIGENLGTSSRTISGAMRKLVSDGYVEKVGQSPIAYALTEKGKSITIEEEN